MAYKFNASKYENLFNQMHGSGSFQSGINQASNAGYLKGYASVLKPYYLSALRKRMKEAQEQQERLQTVQQLKAAQSPKVQHDKMKDYMRENFGENIDTGKKYINKNAKSQPKKKQSIIGTISKDVSKAANGLKEDAQDAANLLNPFASAKSKVKSTARFSKKVVNRANSVGNFFNGAIDKNGYRVNKHGLYAGVDRYVVPVSKAMDDVLTGGANSKLMKKNATNKKGKITDPGVKAAEKNRGTETKILNGVGTALGYAAPFEKGYGVAGKTLSVGGKLLKGTKAASVAGKVASKAPKLAKLGKIAVKGATGSAIGQAGVEGLQEAFNPKANNLKGHLKNIGTAAAAGAVLDPAFRVGGKAVGKGLSKLIKLDGKIHVATNKPLGLPTPKETTISLGGKNGGTMRVPLQYVGRNKHAVGISVKGPNLSDSISESVKPKSSISNTLFGRQNKGIIPTSMTKRGTKITNTSEQIVGSKIKYDQSPLEKAASVGNKLKTNYIDDLDPIKRIFGQKTYDVAMDSRRGNNIANVILHKSFVTPEGKTIGKSFDDVVKQIPRGDYKDFRNYLVLKDAATRMDNGQKVYDDALGMTADKARQMAGRYEKLHPEYKQISNDWNEFHSNLKKHYGVNEDLLSQEASDAMDAERPNYVPMNRQFTASEKPKGVKKFGINNGLEGQSAPVKAVNKAGSQRPIYDPFKSTIEKVGQYTNAAMRNRTMNSMVDEIANDPERYKDIAEIVKGDVTASKNSNNFLNSLDNDFVNLKKNQKLGDQNIVRGMRNGKPVHIKVNNPELLKALAGMGPERSNVVMNIARRFSNLTKQGATGALAPVFAVKGATMDLSQSIIQSKHPMKQAAYTVYGIISGLANELKIPGLRNMARDFELSGGKFDFALKSDKTINKSLGNAIKEPLLSPKGLAKGIGKVASAPFRTIGAVGDVMENAPRMAAARIRLNELGGERTNENIQQAMSAGREATVNYSRRGAVGKDVEAFVPYNNAAIQGTYRIMKAFKEHPVQTAASVATFAVLPKIAEYAQFANDPDYQKLPARVKYRNIIVGNNNDGTFAMIPVEPGYNSFGQLTIDAMSQAQHKNKNAFEGASDALSNVWLPPIATGALQGATQGSGAEGGIEGAIGATTFAPFTAIAANKAFYGGPIVPQRLQNNSPEQQYDERTSNVAKFIGQKTGLSPMKADYLIKSYGGDVSRLLLPLTSTVGGGNPKTVVLRNFISDPVMTNNLANDFYNMKQNITQAQSDARTQGIKVPSWANSYTADQITSQSKYGITRQISDLTKQKQAINANKLMSAKLKEQRIRSLQAQINTIYLDGITQMQKYGVPGRNNY